MILVTGASGFIGSHLVDALLSRGAPVRALVRRSSSREFLKNVDMSCADLATGEGIEEALEGVETVIHAAGTTKAIRAAGYYAGNTDATENLAAAVARRHARLIYVSSLAAAGPSSGANPVTEESEPHPLTHYGRSKLEAELRVRKLVPDATIVRPPVVYGPRDSGVLELFKPISRGIALQIAGPERWVSIIYVKDLVEGLITLTQRTAGDGRTYFLSHPKPVSWTELATCAGRVIGRKPKLLKIPPAAARAAGFCVEAWSLLTRKPAMLSREKVREALCPSWLCDARRAREEFGFEARTSLEDGLAETLAWYKEAGWLRY
jgi:nucleoside-diphosphate-sugar epimerase